MSRSTRSVNWSNECACKDLGPCVKHQVDRGNMPPRPSEEVLIRIARLLDLRDRLRDNLDDCVSELEFLARCGDAPDRRVDMGIVEDAKKAIKEAR